MRPNPQEIADLVTLTEEILNRKIHFCAVFLGNYLIFLFNSHSDIPNLVSTIKFETHQMYV